MPPPAPYRRNPLDEARARFEGQPPPSRFFPPVGQGRTAFGGYISPSAAAKFALEDEEIDYARDRMATQMEGNALSRLQSRSRSRLMPFTEAAAIAGEEARKAEYETARRLAPVSERAKEQALLTQADTSEALRESIPERAELEKLEREKRMDALLTEDPAEQELRKWTDDPNDLMTYRSLFNRTDPTLPKQDRQSAAWRKTMRIRNDREAIADLHEAIADGRLAPDALDSLVDYEMDDDGAFYGEYIKPDKEARRAVMRIRAENAIRKDKLAREREERISNQGNEALKLRILAERKSELARRVADFPDDAAAAADLAAINAELDTMWKKPKAANTDQPKVDDSARQRLLR